MDSSICVATMTRLCLVAGKVDKLALDQRDRLWGQLDAKVAAGDHDAVRRVQNTADVGECLRGLDLRDDVGPPTAVIDELSQVAHILRPANEGQGEKIDSEAEGEGSVFAILVGQRRRG